MKLPTIRISREQIMPWGIGVVIAFLVIGNIKLMIKRYQIQKESDRLVEEAQKLRDSNAGLNKLLEYVRTPAFVEEEARLRFNLAKPGEKVFVVPEDSPQSDSAEIEDLNSSEENTKRSWFSVWWQHFFSK